MKKLYTLSFIAFVAMSTAEGFLTASAQLVYKDVAGIFYNRCTQCHHKNGGAPFSMMNYSETYPWSSLIQADLNNGKMPIWPPDTTYTRFLHERIITSSEKSAILSWIAGGSQKGDTTQAPSAPTYSQYQLYGTPTMTIQIPTFTSNAGATDAYNCFALPTGLTQDRYLRAYEIVPGNLTIVHHVVVNVDTTGTAVNDLSGTCYNLPGNFGIGGYAPGTPPTVFPGLPPLKAGMRIKAGSKIVMQLHYPAGSAGQQDSTKIRLYFYPAGTTGIRDIYSTVPLQNWTLFIPSNTVQTFTAQYPSSGGLPVALSLYAAFPHSHLLCTNLVNYADNGTNTIPLIRISKWDLFWEGYYTFPYMVKVPAGYTLRASHLYDNTTNNPNNPNNPPQTVTAGPNTKDEMLFDSFQWLYYQPGDDTIDIGGLLAKDSLLSAVAEPQIFSDGIGSYIYPNPFSATTTLLIANDELQITNAELKIIDMFGKVVHQRTLNSKHETLNLNLPEGVYFYSIKTGNLYSSGKMVLMPNK